MSQLGDASFNLAILVKAFEMSGSTFKVGQVMMAAIIPQILLGFFIGPWIDRFNKAKVLILVDLARALVVILVPLANSIETLQILLFVLSGLTTVFNPTITALVPYVVKGEELSEGNALSSTTQSLASLVGPALGGIVISSLGINLSFYFDGFSFLFSVLGIFLLKVRSERNPVVWEDGFVHEWVVGLKYVWDNRPIRAIITAFVFFIFTGASVDILLVALVRNTLKLSAAWLGAVDSVWALGMLCGGPAVLILRQKLTHFKTMLLGFTITGLMMILLSVAPNILVTIPVIAFMGVGNTLAAVASSTVLQQSIPQELRGRVFAFRSTLIQGATAMSMVLGGALADKISVRGAIMLAGIAEILWIAGWWLLSSYKPNSSFDRGGQSS